MTPVSASIRRAVPLSVAGLALSGPSAVALEVNDLYRSLVGGCWACDALTQVTDVGLDVAEQAFNTISGEITNLLGMLMAVWLVGFAGQTFLPFGPSRSPGALWNEGAGKIFKFVIVLAFLQASQPFWEYVFMPVISAGAVFSAKLISVGLSQTCTVGPVASGVAGAKAAMGEMTCPLAGIQDVFSKGMLAGLAVSLGGGWHGWTDFIDILAWPGRLIQIFSGVLLALVYAFGFLMFPLLFLDTFLRAVITAIFAPLAVSAGLFTPTSKVTQRAVWALAHSALTMVFASVVVGVATATIDQIWAKLISGSVAATSDWSTLINQLETGGAKLSIFDQSFWMLLAAGIIAIFMLRQASRMAAAFTATMAGDFSGATAGVSTIAGEGARMAGLAAQVAGGVATSSLSVAGRVSGTDIPRTRPGPRPSSATRAAVGRQPSE